MAAFSWKRRTFRSTVCWNGSKAAGRESHRQTYGRKRGRQECEGLVNIHRMDERLVAERWRFLRVSAGIPAVIALSLSPSAVLEGPDVHSSFWSAEGGSTRGRGRAFTWDRHVLPERRTHQTSTQAHQSTTAHHRHRTRWTRVPGTFLQVYFGERDYLTRKTLGKFWIYTN